MVELTGVSQDICKKITSAVKRVGGNNQYASDWCYIYTSAALIFYTLDYPGCMLQRTIIAVG